MKKKGIGSGIAALLACLLATGAGATSLGLFFQPVPVLDDSSAVQQVATLAGLRDSADLKIWGSDNNESRVASGIAPQQVDAPDFSSPMFVGEQDMALAATGNAPAAAAGGGNIIVSEPGILLLIGLGLIAVGVARRRD